MVFREEVVTAVDMAHAAARGARDAPGVKFVVVPSFPVNVGTPAGSAGPGAVKPGGSIAVAHTSALAWNLDGTMVATRTDAAPHAVWIWDVRHLMLLAVLQHHAPVRSMCWEAVSGDGARLAIATGGRQVFLWTHAGASAVAVLPQEEFKCGVATWSRSALLVENNSHDAFTVATISPPTAGEWARQIRESAQLAGQPHSLKPRH